MKGLFIALAVSSASPAFAQSLPGGCAPADFVEVNAPTVTVKFAGMGYSPKCLRVKAGTQVTIEASAVHPLQGIPNATPENPFVVSPAATAPLTRKLQETGNFGYFCTHHGDRTGRGMAGTIQVVQ